MLLDAPPTMHIRCACGATNSAFNPRCASCGAPVREAREVAPPLVPRGREPGVGERFAGYELVAALGVGSSGRVFRAKAPSGEVVVLKLLGRHLSADPDARARFVRELRALRAVSSPFVPRVLDAAEDEGLLATITAFEEGPTLREQLGREGGLDPRLVPRVLRELAAALGALHDAGFVHRDVKPDNVLLAAGALGPEVRLIDFGLVRVLGVRGESVHTEKGAFVGSPLYAAPEILIDDPIGPWTDWWSFGVVAYELALGRRPFEAAARSQLAKLVLSVDPPELTGHPWSPLFRALLQKEGGRRPRDLSEVLALLDAVGAR